MKMLNYGSSYTRVPSLVTMLTRVNPILTSIKKKKKKKKTRRFDVSKTGTKWTISILSNVFKILSSEILCMGKAYPNFTYGKDLILKYMYFNTANYNVNIKTFIFKNIQVSLQNQTVHPGRRIFAVIVVLRPCRY